MLNTTVFYVHSFLHSKKIKLVCIKNAIVWDVTPYSVVQVVTLHGVTSQEKVIFIITALITSSHTDTAAVVGLSTLHVKYCKARSTVGT